MDASDLYEETLRRLVRKWLRKVSSLAPDARRGEVEAVHGMRTGIRRLRTLLGLAQGKRARRLRKGIKELGLRLGAVRDLDVALERVEEGVRRGELFLDSGVFALRAAMEVERRDALRRLRRGLRSPGARRWFRRAKSWTHGKARGVRVHEALPVALEDLAGEVTRLREASDLPTRHELRKAFKRLRYALEMFEDALPAGYSELAEMAHKAQDELGEERDRVALSDRLEQEASACEVMGEDARELRAYARRLREEAFREDVVQGAVTMAAELAGLGKPDAPL